LEEEDEAAIMVLVKGILIDRCYFQEGEKKRKGRRTSIALWWWAFRISQEHTPHQWKLYRVREMELPIRLHRFTRRPSLPLCSICLHWVPLFPFLSF
jgi:hypothetical protein